jgi:hypothetical protein
VTWVESFLTSLPRFFDFTPFATIRCYTRFLKWGRLEYVGAHYLKFHDGPYWIKGGANSPENFLGYKGFDNTVDQGGMVENFLHEFSPHVQDWNPADPNFVSHDTGYDAKGIIGALNYLREKHVNSIYFLPMNLGGDGQETYPFIGASGNDFDNTHYDISKLHQWNIVLDHAQRQGIALHIVLNETEAANRQWLDNGELGVQRMLFYRELVARYSYILALKWNLSEESVFSVPHLYEFAGYIQALDWSRHPIAVHTLSNNFDTYSQIIGAPHFMATSIQYNAELAGNYVETWRAISAAAEHPWIIDMDENNPAATGLTNTNAGDLRKRVLYDVYFSGGNIEWYAGYHDLPLGGDMRLEDFRTREAMWQYMWYARRLMEDFLPFWEMIPADFLLVGEAEDYGGGEVFVKQNEIYAIYLPKASPSGMLTVPKEPGCFELRWYNPLTGNFEAEQTITTDEGVLTLGDPPSNPLGDWVLIVQVCQSTL